MKRNIFFSLILSAVLVSCGDFTKLLKTDDYDFKYEAAKAYYAEGQYGHCAALLEDMLLILKGSPDAEESLIMMAMCNYNIKDYETSQLYFSRYYKTYPKGKYTEIARFTVVGLCSSSHPTQGSTRLLLTQHSANFRTSWISSHTPADVTRSTI